MAMTLDEAEIIFAGWHDNPPAHHMLQVLARLWGWKPPPKAASPGLTRGPMVDAAATREVLAIPGIIAKRDVHDGLPPVMNFEELVRQSHGR